MRKILFVFVITMVSVAWAAAQQGSAPGSAGGQGPGAGGRAVGPPSDSNRPSTAGDAQSGNQPDKPTDRGADASAGNSQMIEGCLGGAAPDFTVTDKAGTVYKLDIPKDADSSPLAAHLGQSVKVRGVVSGAGTSGASSAKSPTIQVEQMARGTGACPAGGSQPSTK